MISSVDVHEELGDRSHVHRFTLRTGKQIISSAGIAIGNGEHVHEVQGYMTSPAGPEMSHSHKIVYEGLEIESGPSAWPMESGYHNEEVVEKGFLPELIDPNHEYVFKTGEYGVYNYWYKDLRENYWRYTNAPEDHADFDPNAGIPIMDRDQPMPHTAPQYFTLEGRKRHIAVPDHLEVEQNPNYDPTDPKNLWYEVFQSEDGIRRYVYLDSDIRENPDLWVQYQLRVVDSGILNYRQFASNLFHNGEHPKDRIVAAILMLTEQGLYEGEELVQALVKDLEFIDETVKLLGRKFICDTSFYDFLTSLIAGRDPEDPLFVISTYHGELPLGNHHLFSIYKYLRVSPHYLLYWRANQIFAKVMNRLAHTSDIPPEDIEGTVLAELQQIFASTENIKYFLDERVRSTLLSNYGVDVEKALPRVEMDSYGVLTVLSDLVEKTMDEKIFSEWLHAEPLHDISPEEEIILEEQVAEEAAEEAEEAEAAEAGPPPEPEAPMGEEA